jgi:hypothetical protein
MRVFGLAFVFADVIIAEKSIAAIAPGFHRVMALRRPILVVQVVRYGSVAGWMMRSMHDDSTANERRA